MINVKDIEFLVSKVVNTVETEVKHSIQTFQKHCSFVGITDIRVVPHTKLKIEYDSRENLFQSQIYFDWDVHMNVELYIPDGKHTYEITERSVRFCVSGISFDKPIDPQIVGSDDKKAVSQVPQCAIFRIVHHIFNILDNYALELDSPNDLAEKANYRNMILDMMLAAHESMASMKYWNEFDVEFTPFKSLLNCDFLSALYSDYNNGTRHSLDILQKFQMMCNYERTIFASTFLSLRKLILAIVQRFCHSLPLDRNLMYPEYLQQLFDMLVDLTEEIIDHRFIYADSVGYMIASKLHDIYMVKVGSNLVRVLHSKSLKDNYSLYKKLTS